MLFDRITAVVDGAVRGVTVLNLLQGRMVDHGDQRHAEIDTQGVYADKPEERHHGEHEPT